MLGDVHTCSMMKKQMRRFLISAVIAIAITAGLLCAIRIPSDGPNIFSLLCLPFYMVGVFFSDNVHQPDEIAAYVSMFLFFFGIAFAAQVVISRIRQRRATTKDNADHAAS